MRTITAKFGGTSMGTAESMRAVAGIISGMREKGERVVAVASATSGTTDMLIGLGQLALEDGAWEASLGELVAKHDAIVEALGVEVDLTVFWEEMRRLLQGVSLLRELSMPARDRLIGFGERISNTILAGLLRADGVEAEMVDAYELVFTDNTFGEGKVDFERTNQAARERLGAMLESGVVPVVTGFIGQAENGQYVTLGRGGSDYTAAILGAALGCDEVQIWTDVDGIYNADPRVVDGAGPLEALSFGEASELAYFGAKVLHPKTIKPALRENIPVRILNTFNVAAEGTVISNEEAASLKSVTFKRGITIINICSVNLLEAQGFLAKIFEVFGRHGVSVDVVSTSEVSVSLTIDTDVSEAVLSELKEFATVEVMTDMAIVCLVGGKIRSNRDVLPDLFGNLREFNVMMVSQGASKRNITFLVHGDQAQDVVRQVFETFFVGEGASVASA